VLRVPAKVEYALRALVALARLAPATVKGDRLAREEDIPFRFLELTLGELRHAGIVSSRRGSDGGYWLSRAADEISVADVLIALEGTLIDVRNAAPDNAEAGTAAAHHRTAVLWDRSERQLRDLYTSVTIADLVSSAASEASGD
jgi:Rrf2 family protein